MCASLESAKSESAASAKALTQERDASLSQAKDLQAQLDTAIKQGEVRLRGGHIEGGQARGRGRSMSIYVHIKLDCRDVCILPLLF